VCKPQARGASPSEQPAAPCSHQGEQGTKGPRPPTGPLRLASTSQNLWQTRGASKSPDRKGVDWPDWADSRQEGPGTQAAGHGGHGRAWPHSGAPACRRAGPGRSAYRPASVAPLLPLHRQSVCQHGICWRETRVGGSSNGSLPGSAATDGSGRTPEPTLTSARAFLYAASVLLHHPPIGTSFMSFGPDFKIIALLGRPQRRS
jgi:hypothetical protein